jgi:hypothetical protein|tara:strand:- start:527 stop:931 length:405 start_codon:yes stop_codon:yes gene_type:complete
MLERLRDAPEVNSIVTITQPKTHPFRIVRPSRDGHLEIGIVAIDGKTIIDIERTQDWPRVWEGSPACRMTRAHFFRDILDMHPGVCTAAGKTYDINSCIGYEVNGIESFDIDDKSSWKVGEAILSSYSGPVREA